MRRLWLVGALGLAACSHAGDREQQADDAYLSGRYEQAYRGYSVLAHDRGGARLWGKAGAAGRRAGMLDSAAAAYVQLAAADPTRQYEATTALAEIANRAVRERRFGTLRRAMQGLERLSSGWPVMGYAFALVRDTALGPEEEARLLPVAMAGAPDAAMFDSLMLAYGALMARRSACEPAAYAFRAVARRTTNAAIRDSASGAYEGCALRLGVSALDGGDAIDADRWFGRVVREGATGWTGRRALIGLGDARLKQGDPIAAAIAWQRAAASGEPDDSLGLMARARLQSLAPTNNTARDSAGMGVR